MDKFWEFIEHLIPGFVITAVLVSYELINLDWISKVTTNEAKTAIILSLFVAISYVLGVFNSSFARFIFTTPLFFMDSIRGWNFHKVYCRNVQLQIVVKKLCPVLSGYKIPPKKTVFKKLCPVLSGNTRTSNEKFGCLYAPKFNRAIFHTVSGYMQGIDSPMKAEISDRRREARLLRSTLIPSYILLYLLVYKTKFCDSYCFGVDQRYIFSVLSICIYGVYLYREVSIVDSIEHGVPHALETLRKSEKTEKLVRWIPNARGQF